MEIILLVTAWYGVGLVGSLYSAWYCDVIICKKPFGWFRNFDMFEWLLATLGPINIFGSVVGCPLGHYWSMRKD